MRLSPTEEKVNDLVSGVIDELGYAIVRIKLMDRGSQTLQIMAERKSDGDLVVEDCELISRTISAIMDVEDPISGEYNLEVSSPGIDRPLTRVKDFEQYVGFDAKVTTANLIDGRKRFKGRLVEVNEKQEITVKVPDQEDAFVIPFEDIDSAQLILTDALLAYAEKQRAS